MCLDVFTKYAWVKPLTDNKANAVPMILLEQEINKNINQINYKGRKFHIKLLQKWLDNDDILLYLTHNKEKAVGAKRFGRTLKSKINK